MARHEKALRAAISVKARWMRGSALSLGASGGKSARPDHAMLILHDSLQHRGDMIPSTLRRRVEAEGAASVRSPSAPYERTADDRVDRPAEPSRLRPS